LSDFLRVSTGLLRSIGSRKIFSVSTDTNPKGISCSVPVVVTIPCATIFQHITSYKSLNVGLSLRSGGLLSPVPAYFPKPGRDHFPATLNAVFPAY